MHRQKLLGLLQAYEPFNTEEAEMKAALTDFVQAQPECFERTLQIGHVTGSAWIVNEARTHALLMHHRKLDRWFQPGGHCDGDSDVQAVAAREAWEETGANVTPVSEQIFDIDIHTIPARKNEPEHLHYDVRFLFQADSSAALIENLESKAVQWIPLSDIHQLNDSSSIMRMVEKS